MLHDGWECPWVACGLAENADKQTDVVVHSGRGVVWDWSALFPLFSLPWELCSVSEQPRQMKRELDSIAIIAS